jgi:hypothetical protein
MYEWICLKPQTSGRPDAEQEVDAFQLVSNVLPSACDTRAVDVYSCEHSCALLRSSAVAAAPAGLQMGLTGCTVVTSMQCSSSSQRVVFIALYWSSSFNDVTTSSTVAYQKHVIHHGTTHPFFTLVVIVQADYLLV